MNPWPIYSHMKMTWRRTGKILTAKEVRSEFPESSMKEIREGMIEFSLAYEKTFSKENHIPENLAVWDPLVDKLMKELGERA